MAVPHLTEGKIFKKMGGLCFKHLGGEYNLGLLRFVFVVHR